MSTIADLFAVQKEIMENLNKLYINFKKEGKERKTSESIKRRLQSLETLWRDFSRNHDNLVKLCDETEDNEYFGDDSYIKTKTFYNDVKKHLLRVLEETTTRSPSPKNQPPTPSSHSTTVPLPSTSDHDFPSSRTIPKKVLPLPRFVFHDVDKPNKVEEMMRKQQNVLKTIESRWAAIDSLHWEIDSNLQGEDSNYEDIFNRYENEYCEIKKSINQRMWDAKHRDNSTPKIDIPIFNGNYQQWISFKDLFNESIHNNNSISPAQKMQFLKMKLRGEAEKLIQHLRVSSDNYQTCWDILNQRYNNKKLIFNSHMNVLMSLPVMHQQTASSIKKLHDTTNECLNALKNLGIDISTWDPIVIYLVSQKMDAETYTDYIDSLPEPRDLPHLQEFLAYLEGKFIALETVRRKTETNKNTQPFHNPQKHSNQSFNTSTQRKNPRDSGFNNANRHDEYKPFINHSAIKPYQKCLICDENHALFICNKFRELNNQEKRKLIAQNNICKNCLINHNGKECTSQKTCRHCHEKHNSLLHNAYVITNPVTNQTHTNQHKQPKCVSHVSKDNEPMTDILLATAQVNVLGADGTYKTMRALIDQGSQTSIISENAAQQLGIHRRRCKGSIFGIGAKESNCKGVMTITIASKHNEFTTNIDATKPIFHQPSWQFLKNIQLADPEFNQSRPVDLLLGAEVYSEIILHGIIKEDQSQPIAQQTQLGWILCGNVKSYYCNVILNNCDDIKKTTNEVDPEKCYETLPRRRASKSPKCSILTMALMVLMLLVSPSHCTLHTKKLPDNQTIYFDKISNMKLIRDEWKLVVFYDMTAYWEGVSLATKYIDHLDNCCQKIQNISHCQLVLLHLRHCQDELAHYNEILTNHGQLPEQHHLRRRGLVNAVGSIAHSLFGVLDDDFAQQYQQDLTKLRSNQKYFNQLLQNQTSIIESEFNVIKRMEKTVRQQHKNFNQHLNKIDNLINSMQKQISENAYTNEFTLSSISANGILMNLKDIQQMLLNTITDIFHGTFNIHLLQPEQLTKELHIISAHLSKELLLPIDNIQRSTKLYHLLTVKTRFTGDNLIFEIKLPLVGRDSFEVYKLTPIPIAIGDKMRQIIIASDLLAINYQKDLQIPLSSLQLQQCIHYDMDILLCAHQIPISITKTEPNYCAKEIESLSCKTERESARIPGYNYTRQGRDTRISKWMRHQRRRITLLSRRQSSNDLKLKPDIINIDIPTINNIVNVTMPLHVSEIDTNHTDIRWELKMIGDKIDQVKNNTKTDLEDETSFNYHDIHHYIAIYVLAGATLLTVWRTECGGSAHECCGARKRRCHRPNRNREPAV
ncbi:hypothetical protein SFRURICE_020988 [Spodoptera frugiperda]|nr:hypothetical protein SFRURICE_020988 [Spodoptera frugiperda]